MEIVDSISDTAPVRTIVGMEYGEHRILADLRRETIHSLSDGNNEELIAKINVSFTERQQAAATVLLNKSVFLRDGVHASGVTFDGGLKVDSVERSEGNSTLVIISGKPLGPENKPENSDPIDVAISYETYVLYTQ